MVRRTAFWALALIPLIVNPCRAADSWQVAVRSTVDLGQTPIVVELKAAVPPGIYQLQPQDSSATPLRAQVFADATKTYLSTVLDGVSGSKPASYALSSSAGKPTTSGVELHPSGADLEILIDSKLFTTYVTSFGPKPYYFPLIGPSGQPITRAYPMKDVPGEDRDHPHQRSLWFSHGKVNGIDFWSEVKGHGSIKETSREVVSSGPVVATIRTTDDWLGPDGKKICSDERVVRVFSTAGSRVMDFDITIKATGGPVTFGDTKEGMFGLRVASSMDVNKKKGGKITNSEGVTDDAAWGKASPWVDYSGPVDGKTVGIAVLNHPKSFRHPTTWHVRTYEAVRGKSRLDGMTSGMGKSGEHDVPEGESIQFRYRLILHEGDAQAARLAEAFRSYSELPQVEVEARSSTSGSTHPRYEGRLHAVKLHVMRLDRHAIDPLLVEDQRPARDVLPQHGQKPVVEPPAATETMAMRVKGDTGHNNPVDLAWIHQQTVRPWLTNSQSSPNEV